MKIKIIRLLPMILAICIFATGCTTGEPAKNAAGAHTKKTEADLVAAEEETVSQKEVVEAGMTPVYGKELKDGVYSVKVDSSSNMFRITECELTVKDGIMDAVMTMSGTGYLKLYMGNGKEASAARETDYIPYAETETGAHTFQVPVEALDKGMECSAFSRRKEKWYDRVLVFRSDSLPAEAFAHGKIVTAESLNLSDGIYTAEVALEGGSGKASVRSPAELRVEAGEVFATIVFSSSHYDYMKVKDEKFPCMASEENSTFEIPISGFDWKIPVIANTIAMSQPHEIDYTLTFDSQTLKKEPAAWQPLTEKWCDQKIDHSMELLYANEFSVDYYQEGFKMITIKDSGRYLVVPEQKRAPQGLPEDVAVIRQPLLNIYLTATSAMDLFRSLDGIEKITLSGTDASGWYIEEAKQALLEEKMVYAGKYNAPDYELILSKNCDLAIESTMIHHSPQVKEKLEKLGIPVLVERSSYESHPLGRMEWLKLYGVLLDREDKAEALFQEQIKNLEFVKNQKPVGKTVAFFYISSNGYVNVRKSEDYISKMIEMAGGTYVPQNPGENENALSTMNMQMEAFYAAAKDADYIIYNSTIDGELESLEELLEKSGLLADFKAVKEGHVWCTQKDFFQESMGLGKMILDLHKMLTEEEPDPAGMNYMYQLGEAVPSQ